MFKKYIFKKPLWRGIFVALALTVNHLSLITALSSCVGPLELAPDIPGEIVALEVEGQIRSTINAATRTVSLEAGENVDLGAVRVTRIELVETASCAVSVGSVLDLTAPLKVTVTTIADYEWTLSATRTHDSQRPLLGGGFEEWHRSNADVDATPNPEGRVWNPWAQGAVFGTDRLWDTGNRGASIAGASNSTPTEPGTGSPANPSGRAARLATTWALIKAAGGNIFFGRFGEFTGINATCHIGHPWQSRPRALKGWYKYFPQPVDRVIDSYIAIHPFGLSREQWMGSPDSLHINIALWASPDGENKPFTVNTDSNAFVDLLRTTPGLIAWGSLSSGDEQAEWTEFTLPIEYLTDEPLPANTHLLLQVTSSKNCNYFIAGTSGGGADGKTGSLMYIDEFELVY